MIFYIFLFVNLFLYILILYLSDYLMLHSRNFKFGTFDMVR